MLSPQANPLTEVNCDPAEDAPEKQLAETSLTPGDNYMDREMRDATSSVRKKRSRNHFDAELDRDQKILATEGAKAQRRSDELDRRDPVGASDVKTTATEAPIESEPGHSHRAPSPASTSHRSGYREVCAIMQARNAEANLQSGG